MTRGRWLAIQLPSKNLPWPLFFKEGNTKPESFRMAFVKISLSYLCNFPFEKGGLRKNMD